MSTASKFEEFHLPGRPFEGKKRLYNVVPIQFRTNFLKHEMDARELRLLPGDEVIVESSRGPAIATVTGHVRRRVLAVDSVRRVLRKANEQDLRQAEKNEELEKEAHRFCIQRVRARGLGMKLVRVNYMHDGSKIVFYFSADGRIDFRDLVKDLAHRYRTRIEMHQIGVRDGTRMVGGIGPCGRELCCSTFLENFAPVSIRMAKSQGLTLNPKKVSGMCGRLMCCLVYEQQLYRKMRKRVPRSGERVRTALGSGEILSVDVVNRRIQVQLQEGDRKTFPLEEVVIAGENDSTAVDRHISEAEYLWDDLEPDSSDEAKTGGSNRSRRRKGRRRGSRSKRRKRGSGGRDSKDRGKDDDKG